MTSIMNDFRFLMMKKNYRWFHWNLNLNRHFKLRRNFGIMAKKNVISAPTASYDHYWILNSKTAAMQKLQSPGARTVRSVWAGASTVGKANACYGGLRSDETNMLCNSSSFTFTLDQDMYAWQKWLPCQIQMLSDYFVCCKIAVPYQGSEFSF